MSPEDDNEDIGRDLSEIEKGREPTEVFGPDIQVVAQDVEVRGDLIGDSPGGMMKAGWSALGSSRSTAKPSDGA